MLLTLLYFLLCQLFFAIIVWPVTGAVLDTTDPARIFPAVLLVFLASILGLFQRWLLTSLYKEFQDQERADQIVTSLGSHDPGENTFLNKQPRTKTLPPYMHNGMDGTEI